MATSGAPIPTAERATTSTTSSVDDEAAPLPGFRAKGSFHPSAGQGGTSRAPPPQPAPSSAEEVVVSSRPRALGLWSVLLVGVVCLATLLVFLSVLDRPDLWVHVMPNALSIVGSLTICCCWLALPELRTTHGGHVFWLSVAQTLYSGAAIAAATSDRCIWQQAARLAWVCTWLWATPVALDWLLLLWHERGAGAPRAALARWCHLVWPVAAALVVPSWLGPQVRLAPPSPPPPPPTSSLSSLSSSSSSSGLASASPALLSGYCVAESQDLSELYLLMLAVPFLLATIFNAGAYVAGMRRSAADTPLIVQWRQRRRAALFVGASLVLQPPLMLLEVYTLWLRRPPPVLLAYWCALAGAPVQGATNALAHFLSEPSVAARLLSALPARCVARCHAALCGCCCGGWAASLCGDVECCPCGGGGGGDESCCCDCEGGGAFALARADTRALLLHADSRHAHFVPSEVHDHQSATYRASGGTRSADPRAADAMLRALEDDEAASAASFRWYWCVLPLLLVVVVLLVMVLAGGT